MTSLAGLVIDTVDDLRASLAAYAADAGAARVDLVRVTFSLAYDPGARGTPLPLPAGPGRVPVMRLNDAALHLARNDRAVGLRQRDLAGVPRERIARFELEIDLTPDTAATGG